jgi:hypothetical protein
VRLHERHFVDFYYELAEPLGLNGPETVNRWMVKVRAKKRSNSSPELEESVRRARMLELKRESAKHIMSMNIYADAQGYIHYNELLLYLYRHHMYTK